MLIKKNPEEFQSYLEDTSNLKGQASLLHLPKNKEEVLAALDECATKKIPLTASGGRTGTTGGCVPQGGAVISLEHLQHIEIDEKLKLAYVGAGVSLENLEKEANKVNLTLRASPTEPQALVGGVLSTSASGIRGFGYGSIRDYVVGIVVILSSRDILTIRRGDFVSTGRTFDFRYKGKKFLFHLPSYTLPCVKSQAGYFVKDNMNLIDVFIGSEGTLGIITSATLRLKEIPFAVFDGLVFFNDETDALQFVDRIKTLKDKAYLKPAALEFFDNHSLDFLRIEYSFIPAGACAAVYFEQEVEHKDEQDTLFKVWTQLIEESNASLEDSLLADTHKERKMLFAFRHRLPQLINEFLRQNRQIKAATDCAVPWEHFKEMYIFYKEKAKESNLAYVNFGHIGEAHLHFNFLSRSDSESQKAKEYLTMFCQKAVSLGGTVSAEHGIGKIKKPYLKIMYAEKHMREMAALKKYLDPPCLLGLDNIFDKELLFTI